MNVTEEPSEVIDLEIRINARPETVFPYLIDPDRMVMWMGQSVNVNPRPEQALGKKAEIDFQPMQPGDVQATYADIEASQRDLGFQPSTPIDEGIPQFVAWYREYHGV